MSPFEQPASWHALLALVLLMTAVWVPATAKRDVSWIDPVWSVAFGVAASVYAWSSEAALGARAWIVLATVWLWAARLGGYLTWRKLGEPGEDRRYAEMRAQHPGTFPVRSLVTVFWLQAGLAWIVSMPLLPAITVSSPLSWLDGLGLGLFVLGFLFEAVGDLQLARFKADPSNEGEVLDSGLWRYTRHPNYFGNFCMWWGWYAMALATGAWWSILGPLVMSVMLLRVSGVSLLEKDIADRRPAYAEYKRRTNAFFPGPRSAS